MPERETRGERTGPSAWIRLDAGAYRSNLRALAAYAGVPVFAVVKANAYGHGIEWAARTAVEAGSPGVAVALPEEGARLRVSGAVPSSSRILVMSLTLEEQADLLVEHDLEAAVSREEMLPALSEAARIAGLVANVHVKVDTGMTRAGIPPEQALAMCRAVREDPCLRLAGVMTHFASADAEDSADTLAQWERFRPLVEEMRGWAERPHLHAANSAAAVWFPETRLDWVRAGLVTYGVTPGPRPLPFPVLPVASLLARVVQVREVAAGSQVSYGGTWTAPRTSRLALVRLGYADGLPWSLGNRGAALVHARRAPIRGRVCMDQVVLDVTDLPPVSPGDAATFIGRSGAQSITVQEVADAAGTIPYEVLTRLSERIPRVVCDVR